MGNFSAAKDHFVKCYLISKRIGYKKYQAESLISVARLYMQEGNFDATIAALRECEVI
jgi:hypothetical protein